MTPQELFDELAAEHLSRPEVAMGRMLRTDGLKVHGKVFAMLVNERLVVKVPASQAAALVADGQAVPLETGRGRKMKEWVSVSGTEGDTWAQLMSDAFGYVESISRPG